MLARIAAAKQYAKGAAAPAGATTAVGDRQQQQQQQAGPSAGESAASVEERRAAWEAELREKERAARGDGSYSALLTQLEAGPQQPQEPNGGDKQLARPDFYTSPEGPGMDTLWENSARAQGAGRGSATQA
ncbi:hypothetical protein MNEG_15900, partial [Monoraphidium neglectum]